MNDHSTRDAWESNSVWWDRRYGEGNDFQNRLIGPVVEELLDLKSKERVLDIACGNGAFARRMAALGASVVGVDFSRPFLECARSRSPGRENIVYKLLDVTDREGLLSLGEARYDAAVCNMALMDMEEIDPLAEVLSRLLAPGGRFVFSVLHPCFTNGSCRMQVEQEDRSGTIATTRSIKVTRYISPFSSQGTGIIGQPVPQWYFHRPLRVLIGVFLSAGFVCDALEERAFPPAGEEVSQFSWENFPEIPPILIVRLRPVAKA